MKNNRGFTLLELIATLIVLSIVALIAIPNIKENLNEAKQGIKNTQLESIVNSAKSWAVDHINDLPTKNNEAVYVFLKDLQSGGYIDNELYENTDGDKYNDNIFVLIKCEVIEANEWNNENYKYTYTLYDTNSKHLEYLASLYAVESNITSTTNVTLSELLPYANSNLVVSNKLKNIEDGSLISNASVTINYDNGIYSFNVKIN